MPLPFTTAAELAKYLVEHEIDYLDCCFADPLGMWHHTTFHRNTLEEKDIKNGFAFDGSSIRLFTKVEKSDMVMLPDVTTCWVDPFYKEKTIHVTCKIVDCGYTLFPRCPRGIGERVDNFVKKSGIADKIMVGPEAEFFVFDHVSFDATSPNIQSFKVDGVDAAWNSACTEPGNLGHRMPLKSSYFPVMPIDPNAGLRTEMLTTMGDLGIPVEKHHHEVASCQHELGFACREMIETCDFIMAYKYVVKNVAHRNGKTATFMPKPLAGDCGSGMHCHMSLWKDGTNLFWDEKAEYCKLSQLARYYVGGLLKHAKSVLAFSNPSVNSYKRLVPGYEAPSCLVYSRGNRSAAIRVPLFDGDNPKAKRIEFRCPDPIANPYLATGAMVMAGMDGIINKIEPPAPLDVDIYHLSPAEAESVPKTPASLDEALNALEADHEFLTRDGVFPKDFIDSYIQYKRAEAKSVSLIPTAKEFQLYYHA